MLSRRCLTRPTGAAYTQCLRGCAWYSSRTVKEHDVLLLRQKSTKGSKRQLSPPILADTKLKIGFGATINGSDAIGKSLPCEVKDSRGRVVRLSELTLPQYVSNLPRVATPIYPHDASMIVSILDLHLPRPGEDPEADAQPPTEIFEAGTGMGSLSLQLARAIHGANPPVPAELREALFVAPYQRGGLLRNLASDDETPGSDGLPHEPLFDEETPKLATQLEAYRASRRAILQTLDINSSTSRKAHGVVRGFRRAQYLLDMDFHVQTIRSYVEKRLASNGREPIFSHAILDLPGAADHADVVLEALKPDGKLVVFFPSITQVLEFVVWATETKQRIFLAKVIELQPGTFSQGFRDGIGGREWDVRIAMLKKDLKAASKAGSAREEGDDKTESDAAAALGEVEASPEESKQTPRTVHVCRPKVGTIIGGGGFLAVYTKRLPPASGEDELADMSADEAETISEAEPEAGRVSRPDGTGRERPQM